MASRSLPARIATSILFDVVVPWSVSGAAVAAIWWFCRSGFGAWLALVGGWSLGWVIFLFLLIDRRGLALAREAKADDAAAD